MSIVRRLLSTTTTAASNKLRFLPATVTRPGLAILAGSSIAGGLSLALYDKRPFSNATTSANLGLFSNFFSSSSSSSMPAENFPVQKSDEEWRLQLSPEQFRILRKKGTEMAGTGEYDSKYPTKGTFNCAGCDAPLYDYDSKFKSGCGWPAFFENRPGAVTRHVDNTFGMQRTEIVCSSCGGHLGHVFKGEGFGHPKDERHCVNSISLKYNPDAEASKDSEK